jgi:hypothetical protein
MRELVNEETKILLSNIYRAHIEAIDTRRKQNLSGQDDD